MKLLRLLITAVCAGVVGTAQAQARPELPNVVKIVVPYTAGGVTDLLARFLADRLQAETGRTFLVENKPGASGQIGTKAVSQAQPDGGTLLVHTPAWITSKIFFKNPLISVPDGLEPVTLLTEEAYVLAASMPAPFKTVRELVAYAKANPGKLNYASGGLGDSYLVFGSFMRQNQLDMVSVEYKGAAPTMTALMSDEVQLAFQSLITAQTYAASGRLKILGVSGDARHPAAPDIPTLDEQGIKHARHRWMALYAPPKTPRPMIEKLNALVNKVLDSPEARQKLAEISMVPKGSTPEELRKLIHASLAEYTEMAKVLDYQPQ
jgi:tripartite-type tricarboxylate transporter receptor subunit TctC